MKKLAGRFGSAASHRAGGAPGEHHHSYGAAGIVIGTKGGGNRKNSARASPRSGQTMQDVRLQHAEIRKPELDAKLVGKASPAAERGCCCRANESGPCQHHALRRIGHQVRI